MLSWGFPWGGGSGTIAPLPPLIRLCIWSLYSIFHLNCLSGIRERCCKPSSVLHLVAFTHRRLCFDRKLSDLRRFSLLFTREWISFVLRAKWLFALWKFWNSPTLSFSAWWACLARSSAACEFCCVFCMCQTTSSRLQRKITVCSVIEFAYIATHCCPFAPTLSDLKFTSCIRTIRTSTHPAVWHST